MNLEQSSCKLSKLIEELGEQVDNPVLRSELQECHDGIVTRLQRLTFGSDFCPLSQGGGQLNKGSHYYRFNQRRFHTMSHCYYSRMRRINRGYLR
jgi:hypothetical protein